MDVIISYSFSASLPLYGLYHSVCVYYTA